MPGAAERVVAGAVATIDVDGDTVAVSPQAIALAAAAAVAATALLGLPAFARSINASGIAPLEGLSPKPPPDCKCVGSS